MKNCQIKSDYFKLFLRFAFLRGNFMIQFLKGKPIVLRSKKKAERSAEMKDFRKLSFFGFTLPEALNS